ncbi:MAG: hypothetical protein EB127_25710, partial [Alphaproteobacteria bacterium]|nr:hypothetical protein [Alphaproteobacteria bacterium]
ECGSWDTDEYRKDLLIAGTETNYFLTRYKLYVNMIYNLMKYHNLKYSNISFVLDKLYFMDIKVIEKGKDYARDQLHSGNITHQSISDYLISDYTDKYKNATIYSTFRGKSV